MKVKVDVSQLKEGMYVSELDRSWTDTSFLLQGVLIENKEDISQFQSCCEYVYIDADKSHEDIYAHLRSLSTTIPDITTSNNSIEHESQQADLEQHTFQKELKVARKLHSRTRSYVDQALEDVRLGQAVDTEGAKEIVAEIANSIARSPHALLWLTNMKERDEYTSIHCMNVCVMAVSFGRSLGMDKAELEVLGLGGLLHDLGKMRVPLEILNKPSKLTFDEFEVMKTHPMEGYNMLKAQGGDLPSDVLDIVKHHHERRNGKGYPSQLNGDEISNMTRIIAIVDVYDAITSDRCYHDAISPYDALKNMYEWVKEDFDKEMIEQFIKCLGIYPIGCVVELNMGHVGLVVSASEKSKLRPIVMLVSNSKGEKFPKPKLINLAHPKWRSGSNKLEVKHILNSHEYDFNIKDIVMNENIM
ncbi:MAG: HD-GYP domain-containing protein [Gammaproteobacteria bacterium]|nr:HD-GYP domain-containing protein [Gammaproteobacteria bacterium]